MGLKSLVSTLFRSGEAHVMDVEDFVQDVAFKSISAKIQDSSLSFDEKLSEAHAEIAKLKDLYPGLAAAIFSVATNADSKLGDALAAEWPGVFSAIQNVQPGAFLSMAHYAWERVRYEGAHTLEATMASSIVEGITADIPDKDVLRTIKILDDLYNHQAPQRENLRKAIELKVNYLLNRAINMNPHSFIASQMTLEAEALAAMQTAESQAAPAPQP
jgi:hypothetical protein